MKVLTILGARPQFIKAAPVSAAIGATPGLEEVLVHTGQHYDREMSDVFFSELGIPMPKHFLGIGSGPHGQQTGRMLETIEQVINHEKPDVVLVYGDTNSTLAGALAAAKLHVPVAHVEAGLRSFNRAMPEEVNRVATDHLSAIHFAPTRTARANLEREGISPAAIELVGDVMYDAILSFGPRAREKSKALQQLGLEPHQYILASIHRAENTDDPARLEILVDALKEVSGHWPVVLPLHPRTRERCKSKSLLEGLPEGLKLCPPVGYLDMLALENGAVLIATDSGGVQKEAYFQRVPCVTLREESEWIELIELGWNRLSPPTTVTSVVESILGTVGKTGREEDCFGDGTASRRIARRLAGGKP